MFIFSCLLTSVFTLSSNFATIFFAFSKSFFLSQLLYSAVNLFHHTKYFTTLSTFLLFNIFSISHSLTPSISTNFTSFTFCLLTCSLYHTAQLTFTTRWILIKAGSHNLTALVDTTSLMIYRPIY